MKRQETRRPRRATMNAAAFTAALALTAAACGAGSSVAGESSGDRPVLSTEGTSPATAEAESAGSGQGATESPAPESETGESGGDDAGESAAPAAENLFAPVDVTDLASDQSVNLAQELGGGDKAVLLWFWAPH